VGYQYNLLLNRWAISNNNHLPSWVAVVTTIFPVLVTRVNNHLLNGSTIETTIYWSG
jgi:hypothetical protein